VPRRLQFRHSALEFPHESAEPQRLSRIASTSDFANWLPEIPAARGDSEHAGQWPRSYRRKFGVYLVERGIEDSHRHVEAFTRRGLQLALEFPEDSRIAAPGPHEVGNSKICAAFVPMTLSSDHLPEVSPGLAGTRSKRALSYETKGGGLWRPALEGA
jgi:hypothetical protein